MLISWLPVRPDQHTSDMSILDRIHSPADLKPMTRDELRAVSEEMRVRLIETCSRTGGHIGAGLGVVELTVALHAVFDAPRDRIVWDVGHQGYPHKFLTGRADRFETCLLYTSPSPRD